MVYETKTKQDPISAAPRQRMIGWNSDVLTTPARLWPYTANFLQGRNGNENLRGCDIHGFMGGTLAKAHISVSRM